MNGLEREREGCVVICREEIRASVSAGRVVSGCLGNGMVDECLLLPSGRHLLSRPAVGAWKGT